MPRYWKGNALSDIRKIEAENDPLPPPLLLSCLPPSPLPKLSGMTSCAPRAARPAAALFNPAVSHTAFTQMGCGGGPLTCAGVKSCSACGEASCGGAREYRWCSTTLAGSSCSSGEVGRALVSRNSSGLLRQNRKGSARSGATRGQTNIWELKRDPSISSAAQGLDLQRPAAAKEKASAASGATT